MLMGLMHIHNIWVMRAFFFFIGVFIYGPDSMLCGNGRDRFRHQTRCRRRDRFRQRHWLARRSVGRLLAGRNDDRKRLDGVFSDIFGWLMFVGDCPYPALESSTAHGIARLRPRSQWQYAPIPLSRFEQIVSL